MNLLFGQNVLTSVIFLANVMNMIIGNLCKIVKSIYVFNCYFFKAIYFVEYFFLANFCCYFLLIILLFWGNPLFWALFWAFSWAFFSTFLFVHFFEDFFEHFFLWSLFWALLWVFSEVFFSSNFSEKTLLNITIRRHLTCVRAHPPTAADAVF